MLPSEDQTIAHGIVAEALRLFNETETSGEGEHVVTLYRHPKYSALVWDAAADQLRQHGFKVEFTYQPPGAPRGVWSELPKFMVADPGEEADAEGCGYVLHNHEPRFLLKINDETGEVLLFSIDRPESARTLDVLTEEAKAFYHTQMGLE